MRKAGFTFILFLTTGLYATAQTTRYFEFTTGCGHGNWQDTSFIAATSDQAVIDTVLANLSRPFDQRNFISGYIDYGDGGVNHNADHWFLWHFIPDQWNLVENAIEVCDGCPYSDVDADTAYWVRTVGQYCPWTGRPVREVQEAPTGIRDKLWEKAVSIYPNPAKNSLKINWNSATRTSVFVSIFNSFGQVCLTTVLTQADPSIDLTKLGQGVYFVKISDLHNTCYKTLVVNDS